MACAREGASLWIYLHRSNKYKSFRSLKRLVRSSYFIQDTILTPFNRAIGCKLLGHRKTEYLSDFFSPDDTAGEYCYNCYRKTKDAYKRDI